VAYTIRIVKGLSQQFDGAQVETVDRIGLGVGGRVVGLRDVTHVV
jgi:hypothetical protein